MNYPVRKNSRIIKKRGKTNIKGTGVDDRKWRYVSDLFTTMIDIKWRWTVLIFVSGFILVWLIFAVYYWLVCRLHGDFSDAQNGSTPCLRNVGSFVSAYLFSIETQSTIGYGFRFVTEECPYAYIGVLMQSIIGAGLQVALAGLVVVKIGRAKKRAETIVFSTKACIVEENLKLQLVFRIGDMRKSHLIGVHARGILLKMSASKTGANFPVQSFQVDLRSHDGSKSIFVAWPTLIVHDIDEKSPFWSVSRDDVHTESFELVVIVHGVIPSTGMAIQVRHSYLPWDIIWGHRFVTLDHKINKEGQHIVNYDNFHKTFPVPTPLRSAREIHEMLESGRISVDELLSRSDFRSIDGTLPSRRLGGDLFLRSEEEQLLKDGLYM